MIDNIKLYFFMFMFYSFLGWIMEIANTAVYGKKFVNRGFLIGPYCPIYGFGVLLLTFFLTKYKNDIVLLIVLSMVICGFLEYYTSLFMEKIFNARWWDYTNKKFNINGRICLENLIPFAIIGTVIIKLLNPLVISVFYSIPTIIVNIIFILLFISISIDTIISFKIIIGVKKITNEIKDNTEEISKMVRARAKEKAISLKLKIERLKINSKIKDNAEEFNKKLRETLKGKSLLYKRLGKAFPNIRIKTKNKKAH